MDILCVNNFLFSKFRLASWILPEFVAGSKTSNVKTLCRKSYPVNILQVSDLIFKPCFKVQFGHCIDKAFYLPSYCSLHFEPFSVVRLPPFLLHT